MLISPLQLQLESSKNTQATNAFIEIASLSPKVLSQVPLLLPI